MTKTFLAYFLIIIFVGFGVWLFARKDNTAEFGLNPSVTTSPSPSPTNQIIKMENGLQIEDLRVGTGAEAKTGQVVTAHYLGTLEDGTKFDSSYDRGQPFQFTLGKGEVIQGWDQGIVGMRVGGKRKLVIPSSLGYGPQGMGPIPGNATLVFEVELLGVQDGK